jgi:ribonuclease E
MLIDATHAEETRVAVIDGQKLIEFDYESKLRRQLKGGIFLAKVTRVEPSLQAAFVNFGGNRHGFLPFSEIHPDYFRIPVADREALLAEQKAMLEALAAEEEAAMAEEEAAFAALEAKRLAQENGTYDEQNELQDTALVLEPHNTPHEAFGGMVEDPHAPRDSDSFYEQEMQEAQSYHIASDELIDAAGSAEDEQDQDQDDEENEEIEDEISESETDSQDEDSIGNRLSDEEQEIDDNIGNVEQALDENGLPIEKTSDQNNNRRGRGRGRFRGRGRGRNYEGRSDRGGDNRGDNRVDNRGRGRNNKGGNRHALRSRRVEMVGGDTAEGEQPFRYNLRRNYKIQEVIKRGQIMLVQVQKEERGNKGAAVTTYLSLPGRYCVLMPNSPRGGGVSRKIASFAERKRMREILKELSVPDGMSVILRTAGVQQEKDEIKRDLDYLMRLWDNVRELTLESSAPALIYEESNLVKRAVRDIYGNNIDEIFVSGQKAYEDARNFMKLLMPADEDNVKLYKDEKIPLFHRHQVESQIADIGEPVVHLRSGGYLVINPTEALVSVDVNSGRATKERHIEETALKTNLEAADEVARQLRLRDLGGLVVIDFIDMEDYRNNAKVERRLREALSSDRARIQVGRISSFGLLELSRQRLNPSLTEAQFEKCPHCKGAGIIRTVDSVAILALRALEDEGIKGKSAQVFLTLPNQVALYILNQKRERLAEIEMRYNFSVFIRMDDSLAPNGYTIEGVKAPVKSDEDEDMDHAEGGRPNKHSIQQGREHTQEDGDESAEAEDHQGEDQDPSLGNENPDAAPALDHQRQNNGGRDRGGRNRGNRSERPDRADRNDRHGGRNRKFNNRNRDRQNTDAPDHNRADNEPSRDVSNESGSDSFDRSQNPANDKNPVAQEKTTFKAKRFSSRRSETPADTSISDAKSEAKPVDMVKNDGNSPQPSEQQTSQEGGAKRKGWWNRLVQN